MKLLFSSQAQVSHATSFSLAVPLTYHSAEAAVELQELFGEGGEEETEGEDEGAHHGRQPRRPRLAEGHHRRGGQQRDGQRHREQGSCNRRDLNVSWMLDWVGLTKAQERVTGSSCRSKVELPVQELFTASQVGTPSRAQEERGRFDFRNFLSLSSAENSPEHALPSQFAVRTSQVPNANSAPVPLPLAHSFDVHVPSHSIYPARPPNRAEKRRSN